MQPWLVHDPSLMVSLGRRKPRSQSPRRKRGIAKRFVGFFRRGRKNTGQAGASEDLAPPSPTVLPAPVQIAVTVASEGPEDVDQAPTVRLASNDKTTQEHQAATDKIDQNLALSSELSAELVAGLLDEHLELFAGSEATTLGGMSAEWTSELLASSARLFSAPVVHKGQSTASEVAVDTPTESEAVAPVIAIRAGAGHQVTTIASGGALADVWEVAAQWIGKATVAASEWATEQASVAKAEMDRAAVAFTGWLRYYYRRRSQ